MVWQVAMTPQPQQCFTPVSDTRRTTQIVFGENQLFPSLFSLSPLSTAHPLIFQISGFGPPVPVTAPSSWPWIDHPVSGLRLATKSPLSDSLSLRLPYSVKLATKRKSLTHYTKGTQSPHKEAPTVCMHAVSGSISLPSRGSFRLSLTVLVHYRSITSIQPWRMVPPCSDKVSRAPPYFSLTQYHGLVFMYGAITHYGRTFHSVPLTIPLSLAGSSPFARHYLGNLG
eukprot:TRINITY_DN24_c0_g2_i17.p1 TRINITY_DN24_c0_g2~~TRINITY_DN24_c0_g2_i17.p1  ORF type:complete len:227 (-),score=-88.90 TRINITY_DN24_c0_g2_i17:266-946(-)